MNSDEADRTVGVCPPVSSANMVLVISLATNNMRGFTAGNVEHCQLSAWMKPSVSHGHHGQSFRNLDFRESEGGFCDGICHGGVGSAQ